MITQDNLFGLFSRLYDSQKETEMSLEDYLKCCAREPMAYASAAERMLAARRRSSTPAMIPGWAGSS